MSESNGHRQLSADDILAAEDLDITEVQVAEWKGAIHLRVLPADEGLVLNEKMHELPNEKASEAMFMLLAACMVNADGSPIFRSPDQARMTLGKRSSKVLLRIQKQALEHQGWLEEAAKKNVSGGAAPVASPTG